MTSFFLLKFNNKKNSFKITKIKNRLDEDPIGVFNKLTENAENILQQLKSLSFEVDMITQSPSPTKTGLFFVFLFF